MMRDITRMDIRKITPYGRYIDLDKPLLFDLTDEEIIALRKYHNKPEIAIERKIVKKNTTNIQNQQSKRHYKVTREQKYNSGRHRVKKKINHHYGLKVIVGGILVFLVIGSKTLKTDGPRTNVDVVETFGPSYTEYIENSKTLNDLTEEALNSIDVDSVLEQYENSHAEENIDEEVDNIPQEVIQDEISERELLIQDICNIYQLDYNVVYQNLVNLTNDFTNEEYLNGRIQGVTCKGASIQANTEEELLVYAIRCMKQLPSQMGVSTEGLYCKNGYVSGTNYYEQLNRVANVLGVNRCLLYAIVNAECSFNSPLFNESNNPAGLRLQNGDWWSFDTKEEGFFELGMEILKYYRKIGISPDNIDRATLSMIRDIHAPLSDGNQHWLPNVLSGLEYAQMHEAEMFGNLEQNNGLSF